MLGASCAEYPALFVGKPFLDTPKTLPSFQQESLHLLHWGTAMSAEDLEMEKMKFNLMDRDQTGTIDWYD